MKSKKKPCRRPWWFCRKNTSSSESCSGAKCWGRGRIILLHRGEERMRWRTGSICIGGRILPVIQIHSSTVKRKNLIVCVMVFSSSFNCVDWFLLPTATEPLIDQVSIAAKGRFTGDPSHVYEHIRSRGGDEEDEVVVSIKRFSGISPMIHNKM